MLLAASFFLTALIYASVGFGGGSTYNALLVLADADYRALPVISLLCNLIVVTGGVWCFFRAGHISFHRLWPWIFTSIPAAWLGGFIKVDKALFLGLLGGALLFSALRLLWQKPHAIKIGLNINPASQSLWPTLCAGGGLGFLAGLTGIGGGIFLAPVLHFLRWGNAKSIAGACSFFIMVNSLAGLFIAAGRYYFILSRCRLRLCAGGKCRAAETNKKSLSD